MTIGRVLVALFRPGEVAVSVYFPTLSNIRFVKVAMPLEAFTVVVPVTPASDEVMVTAAFDPVTT
jgi:hypothetical protein